MILQDIKETKRYGRTDARTDGPSGPFRTTKGNNSDRIGP